MSESQLFSILTAALLILFIGHRAYYHFKYPPSDMDTLDRQGSSVYSILALIFAFLAHIATFFYLLLPNLISWASLPYPTAFRWIGVGIALIGFALLEWSQRVLGSNWSDQPRISRQQELVENGPYRWVRHPMYTSFLLILGSTLFLSANWLVGFAWIVMATLDAVSCIRYEERALEDRFGEDYMRYRRTTGLLLPKI